MNPTPTVTLDRRHLDRVVRVLSPLELRALIALVVRACPATGRVWTTVGRLAEDLALTTSLVAHLLAGLVREGLIETRPSRAGPLCIEVGELLVREDAAPPNLPVGS